MDENTLEELKKVLEYLLEDEKKHWEESGKPRKNHIYLSLRKLKGYADYRDAEIISGFY